MVDKIVYTYKFNTLPYIDYLKDEYGIVIEEIPGWQLKSEVHTSYSSSGFEHVGYGLRITKE